MRAALAFIKYVSKAKSPFLNLPVVITLNLNIIIVWNGSFTTLPIHYNHVFQLWFVGLGPKDLV